MMALWWRDRGGEGQMIDLSIYEPLFWILGPQSSVYDQLGVIQERMGNRAPFTAPRKLSAPVRLMLKQGSNDMPLRDAQIALPLTRNVPAGSQTDLTGPDPLSWTVPITEPSP